MKEEKRRYVGIDLGKFEYTMAIIGINGKVSIHKGKTSHQGRTSLYKMLEKTDKIAVEAGNLAFLMAGEIQQHVGSEVRVLNSAKLPFIWDAPTKTDKEDAIKLARLVEERRDEKLPIVPLPSEKEMERREIVSNYSREMRCRTRVINTLHSLFVKQGITTMVRKNLATVEKAGEAVEVLKGQLREDAESLLEHLKLHEKRIKELKAKMQKEAKDDQSMKQLQTIAGVGLIVAYVFVAYIGDGSRFSKGAQVSNYLGFVPRLYYSGTIERHGHITKRGNSYLRGLLIQAAWAMVRSGKGGSLKERYIYLTKNQGHSKKKTIVSIGRRMSELMYTILREKTDYAVRPWIRPLPNTALEMAKEAISA
jgi:transposase